MKEMKRILSLVLCLAMLVGMLPMFALKAEAAETPVDALVVFSDLHVGTSGTSSSAKKTLLQNVLSKIQEENIPVSSVASAGDMYSSNESTVNGNAAQITDWVNEVFDVTVNYVWTDHDRNASVSKESGLVYSGNYYVYLLSMADLSTNDRYKVGFYSDAQVTQHIEAFKTAVAGLDKTKPLFIVGHQPLFDNRNDNFHAYEWAVAINEVAADRDVAYFFGHNHDYDQPAEYYYAKGSSIQVPDLQSNNHDVKLNFTHVCAGYMDPGTKDDNTRLGTALAVVIYEDSIQFTAYDVGGVYDTDDRLAVNESVTRAFATKMESSYVGIPGPAGANDVTVSGNGWTTIIEEIPETPAVEGSTTYKYTLDTDGTVTDAYDDELGYLIVAGNNDYAMAVNSSGNIARQSVTIQDGAITLTEIPAYQWKITSGGKINNGTYWLDFNYSLSSGATATLVSSQSSANAWIFNNQGYGSYRVYADYDSIVNRTYYLRYSNNTFNISTSANTLRLFKGEKIVTEGTEAVAGVPGLYAYLKGELTYNVTSATTAEEALAMVMEGIDIQCATYADKRDETSYPDDGQGMTWTLDPAYDPAVPGDYAVTIAYNGTVLGVAEVIVPPALTYYIAEGPAVVIVEENTSPANAMAAVQAAVTVYSADDAQGTNKTAVADDSVIWTWVDEYNAIAAGPYTVNITKGGNVLGSLEVKVNTENQGEDPNAGDSNSVTVSGSTVVTKTVYVLTNSISAPNSYLIVDRNSAGNGNALANNNGSVGNTTVTVKSGNIDADTQNEIYIELDNAAEELWTVGAGYTFQNNGSFLGYTTSGNNWNTTYTFALSGTSRNWTYSSNRLYTSVSSWNSNTNYYLRYNNGWGISTNTANVYFYVPTQITETTTGQVTYTMSAEDLSVVLSGEGTTTGQLVRALLKDGEVCDSLPAGGSYSYTEVSDNDNIIASIDQTTGVVTFTGNPGSARVKVAYTWTANGETYTVFKNVTVKASEPYYSIDLCLPGTDADGNVIYESITEVIAKKGVVSNQTMSVVAVVREHNGQYPDGQIVSIEGKTLNWSLSDEGIAAIPATSTGTAEGTATGVITFSGKKFGSFQVMVSYKDPTGKTITDTITISAAESQFVVPGDGTDDFPTYPNEGAVRFDKTAQAVGNFSETGLALVELSMTGVPFTTDNRMDVVLMLDHSNSMTEARMAATRAAVKIFIRNIVTNEDGTYNNNRIYVGSFAGGNPDYAGQSRHEFRIYDITSNDEAGYQIISSDAELEALIGDGGAIDDIYYKFSSNSAPYGTEYDQSLQKCYELLRDTKADGNKQFCVFMSDGIPNVYRYGAGTNDKTTSSSAMANLFTPTSGTNGSRYTSRGSSYKYEYWSSLMKQDDVTVFSVGLGLYGTNSSLNGATEAECERVSNMLLNDISGPAGETAAQRDTGNAVSKLNSYFFSVADENAATQMGDVFGVISQKILEAAKDVVVEDKIDNNFTVNFSLPENVTADATNGRNEFYIQAVEYQLDENKERTGNPAVLENFTFNGDGTLKSHTVDGVACTSCSHVTFTDGKVTKIDGTYFDYSSENKTVDGEAVTEEFLHWNADKLSTTELALQYFVYLDKSAGYDPADQVEAGTYFTNEYATLTYDNYKGNRVQQYFPIPQMTWNGAQVSYVFYLVNAQGQPVNRAGRVVPFAEAVYVTDVNTYSVVWNDMEQSAGLNANYLAEKLVPEVYALYDDDASYELHVYEDQDEVNLNNHFVIGGDVTDAYNTGNGWTNAKTTYVFNTKADAEKYNVVGAYVKDGVTSYLCKDYSVENATFEEVNDGINTYNKVTAATYVGNENQWKPGEGDTYTGGALIGDGVYYVDENNQVYTIIVRNDATQVRTGFDFSNTTVAFAVVWKPTLAPDTVVVDYGLDVLIDVTSNDAMASGLVGVRDSAPANVTINTGAYESDKVRTVDVYIDANQDADGLKELKIGTATVESQTSVRFSLDKDNAMQFSVPAVFYYESDVNYYTYDAAGNATLNTTSMYSSVTVIPATTIYYEDSFLQFASFTDDGTGNFVADEKLRWETTAQNGLQDQDRPGASKISEVLDADNNYGYDSAYKNMSTFSMGSAAEFTVEQNTRGEAYFTFWGTGFDVIGLTSNTTGTLLVQVTTPDGDSVMNTIVDTYYGCTPHYYEVTYTWMQDAESGEMKWIVTSEEEKAADQIVTSAKPTNPQNGDSFKVREIKWDFTPTETENSLYQIPVMKIVDLPYGQYNVTIMAVYGDMFNHTATAGQYTLYLDAIRIYDPTGNENDTANDAYIEDGEGFPEYFEVRNQILKKATFDSLNEQTVSGIVYIDGDVNNPSIADYASYGPNNEVYLTNGQAIAFDLNAAATVKAGELSKIQLAVKSVGTDAKIEVYGIKNGVKVECLNQVVATATDMYYDITALEGMTVVIRSIGSGIISITNVKVTYTEAQPAVVAVATASVAEEPAAPAMFSIRRSTADVAVASVQPQVEIETEPSEPSEPETEPTVPETKPEKPDFDSLKKAVEQAKKLKEKDYTKESFKALKEALKDAEKVLKNKKATQDDIDEALEELHEALNDLEAKADKKPGKPNPKETVETIIEDLIGLIGAWLGNRN